MDTPLNNKVFAAADGAKQITVNLDATQPLILREPAHTELRDLISEFEAKILGDFWQKALVAPSPYDKKLPYALMCSQGGHAMIPIRTIVGALPTGTALVPSSTKQLVEMFGIQDINQALLKLQPATIEAAERLVTQAGRARLGAFSLAQLWKATGSFSSFVLEINKIGFRSGQERRFAFCALIALRAKNWILLPTNAATKVGHILKGMALHDNMWAESPLSFLSPSQASLLKALTGEPSGKDTQDASARVKARHAVLCTSLSALNEMTWAIAERILFSSRKTASKGGNYIANPLIRLRWKETCRSNGPLAMVEINKVDHLANLRERTPKSPKLDEWIILLANECQLYTGGELNPIYTNFSIWLMWLDSLDNVPGPRDVRRQHIHDYQDPTANTFRKFISERGYELARSQNSPLIRMDKVFQRIASAAEKEGISFSNPIRLVEDKFPAKRGEKLDHTNKARIPAYVMEELQDLIIVGTKDGNFKWSEEIQQLARTRVLVNHAAVEVFCPILPAVLYLMMVYPLRARQVLWLDSGELDARVLDILTRLFVDNPTGIKRRSLGVLQPPTDHSNVQAFQLDFQVAINKTPLAERRRSAFTIHYVPEVITWLIGEVRNWQEKYGAAPRLVKECDAPHTEKKKNANLQEFYPEICPLFRYSGADDFYPPSHAQLTHFWGKLCGVYDRKNQDWAAAQASENAKRRRPQLSKIYTHNGSSWDYPLYGVHSLRVAGVSALLDAGIPLGVVASMTGHLTPVMTLYYYRAEKEQIRNLLSEAKVKLKNLPRIDAIMRNLDECETIDSMLIGTPQAFHRLKETKKSRIWSLSWSGICPGASCDEGLPEEYRQSHGRDVPGSKCALCRFRIYGPAFLGGLVHEFNCLLFELEHLANRQAQLRTLARKAEAQGEEVTAATAHAEDDMLDRETQLHLKVLVRLHEMIQECVEKLNTRSDGNPKTSALITQDQGQITAQLESAGQFAQLKKIIEDSDLFTTSRQVVPDHALRIMQEKLMQMCRANGAEMFLAGLPSEIAKKASLQFAALLEKTVPQRELLEGIFQGRIGFPELPNLANKFQKNIAKSNHPSKPDVKPPAFAIHKTKHISRQKSSCLPE